jgi:hypothetical protein
VVPVDPRASIACTAPMPWMFSVFEGEFVQANNAGPRKNQSSEIPIRLIVVEIFNFRACQSGWRKNPIQHHLRLVYVITWMEEPA